MWLLLVLLLLGTYFFIPHTGCSTFYLLGYSGKGMLIKGEACSIPLKGVYIQARAVTPSVAESLYSAYTLFERRHGPLPYGVVIRFETPVTYVEGRSADASFYAAIFGLVNGFNVPPVTGRIVGDRIEGVSHLREKLDVITGVVIVPFANRYDIPSHVTAITVENVEDLEKALLSLRG